MSSPPIQPGLPPSAMPVPPSWARPAAEKTAPAQETQRDAERQPQARDTLSRTLETGDTVSLSREAQRLVESGRGQAAEAAAETDTATTKRPGELSADEQRTLRDLKARDSEVRRHEQAHQTVGGHLAGAASYETVKGPDGQSYAIGGEVPIDASPEDDPQATIDKMERVKAAALAPAEPSGQDRAVAARADAQKAAASAELRRQEHEEAGATQADTQEAPDGAAEPVLATPSVLRSDVFGPAARAYGTTQAYGNTTPPADRIDLVA
ncbi:putative metalloprotease CJM1_0395 family protein [Caenispirillum salinarum]|uniref:putative metalloprotease CJM1_0395 family protein n=1 Tax=Caenispirillum salinarum TaxID=859058 RepID=UPI00384F9F08